MIIKALKGDIFNTYLIDLDNIFSNTAYEYLPLRNTYFE